VARPVPKIFGMNFQAVSVGQRLAKGNSIDPADAGLIGGYADAAGLTPNNGRLPGSLMPTMPSAGSPRR
jgi:hypothetical protein